MGVLHRVAARQDLILVSIVIMTVLMMVLPMPTQMADGLIGTDIGIALLLMLMAVYVRSPTDFSTLPSLILLTTAFRLSISITTSRLVLVQGDAGSIIKTFGQFVISGNVVVGLVVYFIITVVQFVVITKGAERVAEVAARFTLDALPGKQSSIDTDVRNGDLTPAEAKRRRRQLERESQLYGAMDGAMKFVKGDAIASLIIIAVNLIGGMAIGCLQRGLSLPRAIQTYSLLAVGDGLIAQVPALLVSLTAGLVVTRAAAEDDGDLGTHIMDQVMANARPLQLGGLVLAALGVVPGFPTLLFAALGLTMVGAGFVSSRMSRQRSAADFEASVVAADAHPEPASISIRVGSGVEVRDVQLQAELAALRTELSETLGIGIPRLRHLADSTIEPLNMVVQVDGITRATIEIADARSIPSEVHRVISGCAHEFIGIQEAQELVTRFEPRYGDLVGETLKAAPIPRLAEIIRLLVAEQVSVANLRSVFEAVADAAKREQAAGDVVDRVRIALRRQICAQWADQTGCLSILLLDGVLEGVLRAQLQGERASVQAMPALVKRIADDVARHRSGSGSVAIQGRLVLVVASDLRRSVRHVISQRGLDIPVLGQGELAPEFRMTVMSTIMAGDLPIDRTGVDADQFIPKLHVAA